MVGKDGIIIKDGQIILNSGEKLSIESLIEEASRACFIRNQYFKDTSIRILESSRVVFENCFFENIFFENCDLREISFKNHTVIRNCTLRRCNLNGTFFMTVTLYRLSSFLVR